jgi:hypothetical protein
VHGQPEGAVAADQVGVRDGLGGEVRARGVDEIGPQLDAPHVAGQPREQRGLVAEARPDLEHALTAAEEQRLDHPGDERRLGGHLAVGDRQRHVDVGLAGQRRRDEAGARRRGHRRQHPLVPHAGASRRVDEHHTTIRSRCALAG